MPELPEVQTVVDTIRPLIVGRTIARVEHLRDDIVDPSRFDLRAAITGRTVLCVTRRAKRIMIELEERNRFYIHLGMTGRLTIDHADVPIALHTHLITTLDDGMQLRFRDPRRFGGIFWLGTDPSQSEDKLGPEPLSMRSNQLRERLARTRRAIKNALLDQNVIAGLGNIYVDESLFTARIHPLKRADRLSDDEVRRLTSAIKRTLTKAIHHKGSTLRDFANADGQAGRYQKLHRVYGREDQPCPSCKSPISRIVLGGRSTHFCKRCQKRTAAR